MKKLPLVSRLLCFTSLLFILGFRVSAQCDESLKASFQFGFIDTQTVVLYNTSTGGDVYEWRLEGGAVVYETEASAIMDLEGVSALVCLTVSDEKGCTDQDCKIVYPNSEEALCRQTDCVWPGDANGDRLANIYDLLNIGLGYGATGPARQVHPVPEDPLAWMPNFGEDWDQWLGVVNFKHLDCDGDGVVSKEDTVAISRNYLPEMSWRSETTPGAPPVSLQFDVERIVISEDSPQTMEFSADLVLGSEEAPLQDLYGLALDLQLPDGLLESGAVYVEEMEGSFLGEAGSLLMMQKDLRGTNLNRFDLALSRKDREGRDGAGAVVRLRFVINSDIIGGFAGPEVPFELRLERIRLVNSKGENIPYELPEPVSGPVLIRDIVSDADSPAWHREVQLYPNPATDQLQLNLNGIVGRELILFDAFGRQVLRQLVVSGDQSLDVGRLPRGLYTLHLSTEEGVLARRILLQ